MPTIGVLALQGAFVEHIALFKKAAAQLRLSEATGPSTAAAAAAPAWSFVQVRTAEELARCDALVIPGGESTTMSLVAERSNLLEPLRTFVKVQRKPTWGTCAGLILLAESANRTKKGGQELIGGLDVRVNRNHFGRQTESFQTRLKLPFLGSDDGNGNDSNDSESKAKRDFPCIFIRAPIVEKVLPCTHGEQQVAAEKEQDDIVMAPSRAAEDAAARVALSDTVEVLATLKPRAGPMAIEDGVRQMELVDSSNRNQEHSGDIVAVRQGNVFGTSFHPELTGDERVHVWWLREVERSLAARTQTGRDSR